jgi:hypothetical protein
MKRLWMAMSLAALLLGGALGRAAKNQGAPAAGPGLAELMPRGALLYIEARDLKSALSEWNSSAEKQRWLKSDNYEVFSRSDLFLRLGEAQQQFAAAAGVPPDMRLLGESAGGPSALGLYDIGKLEFLYIARVPQAAATESALWQERTRFESRRAGGATFFVHSDTVSGRVVAFAVTNDYVLLATREDLLAGALELLAGGTGAKLSGEDWYAQAVSAAGNAGDLRMVLNMEKIGRAPHFRSYWIQPNGKELGRYAAAISDAHLSGSMYEEDRVLLPNSEGGAPRTAGGEQAAGDLLRLVPEDAGVYRATADPGADAALATLQTKIIAPHTGGGPAGKNAPGVYLTGGGVGSSADLETRIDQPPAVRAAPGEPWSTLRGLLQTSKVQAMLTLDTAREDADSAFVEIQSAVVLAADSDWDANAVNAALGQAVEQAATTEELGARWQRAGKSPNDYFELDGLLPVRVAVRGKLLIAANNEESMEEILARVPTRSVEGPARYAAGFRHGAEQASLGRLVAALDRAGAQDSLGSSQTGEGAEAGTEPPFFSGNLGSLSRVLSGVKSESVVIRDDRGKTVETVKYGWK